MLISRATFVDKTWTLGVEKVTVLYYFYGMTLSKVLICCIEDAAVPGPLQNPDRLCHCTTIRRLRNANGDTCFLSAQIYREMFSALFRAFNSCRRSISIIP